MNNHDKIEELRRLIALAETGISPCVEEEAQESLSVSRKATPYSRKTESPHTVSDCGTIDCGERDGNYETCVNSSNDAEQAFRKLQRLALRREHSAKQMHQKLTRSGFAREATAQALERAIRCGLIDDNRFAEVLVRSRLSQGKGRQGILRELEDNDIDPLSVRYMNELDNMDDDEYLRAYMALEKHPPRSKNKREGAYRYLIRKGYSSAVASASARKWVSSD